MSIFDDAVSDAMDVWFDPDVMASECTYNGTAILGHMEYGEDEPSARGAPGSRATVMVRKADVAAWAYRDTVVAAGITWRVLDLSSADALTWTLNLTAAERPVYR